MIESQKMIKKSNKNWVKKEKKLKRKNLEIKII